MSLTNHKAGGLFRTPFDRRPLHRVSGIMPVKYVLKEQISRIYDCSPYCDQGNVPACAAYATLASLRMKFWEIKGYPRDDYDPLAVLAEAQKVDGLGNDPATGLHVEGTTIDAAIAACKTLGYCVDYSQREVTTVDEAKWALRHYDNVITGLEIRDGWNTVGSDGLILDGLMILGGHAILMAEYNLRGPGFINSWTDPDGTPWGINGFGQETWDEYERTFMEARAVEWFF